jgi:hypothetical protein
MAREARQTRPILLAGGPPGGTARRARPSRTRPADGRHDCVANWPPRDALVDRSLRPARSAGSSPYTGDSVPLSRPATLSLRTITPSPVPCLAAQVRGEALPIPCSIVRHKPTTRAALEPNKPHRSGSMKCRPSALEFHPVTSATGTVPPPLWSSLLTVTRYIVIRNDQHGGSSQEQEISIVAGNRPGPMPTAMERQLQSVTGTSKVPPGGWGRGRDFPALPQSG